MASNQCYRTGTVTSCLNGTGAGIRYGSGSGSGTGFVSGSKIKWNKTVKKSNLEASFLGKMLILTLKRQAFAQIFFCWKIVLNFVWIRNWSRNRNQNFSKVGTGTGTATLFKIIFIKF